MSVVLTSGREKKEVGATKCQRLSYGFFEAKYLQPLKKPNLIVYKGQSRR